MGVYIRDMEMPGGCPFCPLSHWTSGTDEFAGCNIVPGKRYAMLNDIAFAVSLAKSRPDWCPLIEVPEPHGRLIDADALYSHIKDEQRKCNDPYDGWSECQVALGFVNTAPTVIPAEEPPQ